MFDNIFNTLPTDPGSGQALEIPIEDAPTVLQQQAQVFPPFDLSEQVRTWLDRAISLAESFGVQEVVTELQALDARSKLPGFRLACVGEFNRGKSTLINRILGRFLLPTRALPTTDTITAIVAGSDERMEVQFPDGRQEIRPLAEASWSDLVAKDITDAPQAVFPQVRLTVKHSWLQEVDLEFIDTPGVGDLNDRRSAIVSDVLSQSDAVVMLVSAVLPFSLTEAAFLEQEILGRRIPLVFVVVSMLDMLSEDQPASMLLDVVGDRVARVSPFIAVLPAHAVTANGSDAEMIEAIRSHIRALATKADRRTWRSLKVAWTTLDYLNQLLEVGQTAIATAQMSAAKRDEALRKAREEAHRATVQWEQISLEFDAHRLSTDHAVRQRLAQAKDELLRTYSLEISRTPDPKIWWEKEFPLRLRREFVSLAQKLEESLIDSLARDVQWLQERVEQAFGAHVGKNNVRSRPPLEPTPRLSGLSLDDLQRQLLFSRIGSGAATIAGYLLLGPIGGAISIATGVYGEFFFRDKIEEQRQQLQKEMERSIEKAMAEYTHRLSERLSTLYGQIAQEIKQEQAAWENARYKAIQASRDEGDGKPWQQLIDQTEALRRDMLASLEV